MNFTIMVITDGRGDCLAQTVASLRATWPEEIVPYRKLMVCDSLNKGFRRELIAAYPDFEILTAGRKLGFHGAIQLGWNNIGHSTYIFHLEDDFDLSPIGTLPIQAMGDVLFASALDDSLPTLAQVALKRQAWSPEEKDAGGIVEMWPDLYTDMEIDGHDVTVHSNFFTTNPSLYHRNVVERTWPQVAGSEKSFTAELLHDGFSFAYWGKKLDDPRVEHIGQSRVGTGY
jgi:hypothetical protein